VACGEERECVLGSTRTRAPKHAKIEHTTSIEIIVTIADTYRSGRRKSGRGSIGWSASAQSTNPAAAIPKAAGVVPRTGMVRIRKLGTTW
jgi:hypothetical protein